LGFVFLIDAILNLIAFSGFAKTGLLGQVFPIIAPDDGVLESSNVVSAIRLVVSLGMAVLGALFFVTNSLRNKRERKLVRYSETKFWAGLWFRLGEAVLFTVVFFLALRHYVPDSEQLLRQTITDWKAATRRTSNAKMPLMSWSRCSRA